RPPGLRRGCVRRVSSRRRTGPESPHVRRTRPELPWQVRLSCLLSPWPGQERTDHCLQPLLEREVSDQFTDGKIKDPQPERAEHADGLGTVPGGAPAAENFGQVTAAEFPVPHELFSQ